MNKHLKCVLKLLGTPFVFFIMMCIVPLLLLLMLIDMSGCVDTTLLGEKLLSLPDWYKQL